MSELNGNGNGRDPSTGRMLPGSALARGNKGANPTARRMHELRTVLTEAATDDDVRDIYRAMLTAAKNGDVAAGRLLLEHLVGKPKERVEISGDGHAPDLRAVMTVILGVIGDDQGVRLKLAAAFRALGGTADGMVD